MRGAVHLPPTEARADLAGLVVWDPGFQELRENEAQKGPRTRWQTAPGYGEVRPPPLARPPPSQVCVRATQTDPGGRAVSIPRRKVLQERGAPARQLHGGDGKRQILENVEAPSLPSHMVVLELSRARKREFQSHTVSLFWNCPRTRGRKRCGEDRRTVGIVTLSVLEATAAITWQFSGWGFAQSVKQGSRSCTQPPA